MQTKRNRETIIVSLLRVIIETDLLTEHYQYRNKSIIIVVTMTIIIIITIITHYTSRSFNDRR